MKIKKIELWNFKSIEHYEIEVDEFNVFIGQNNHGKTNLFDALDWFDSGKTVLDNHRDQEKSNKIKIRIHFSDVQKELISMSTSAHKTSLENVIGEADEIVVEKTSEKDKRTMEVGGVDVGNPTGFDSALNYFLPKMVYVTTGHRASDVSGYKSKSPIAEMLGDVLKDMIDNDPVYQDFMKMFDKLFNQAGSTFRNSVDSLQEKVEFYMAKQFGEEAKIRFKIGNPKVEDMLKNFETEVDDGVKTAIEGKGDGMQRALMLAIIQAYADFRKEKGIARNFIFLVDEAELHLHPMAQRLLKNALRDIVNNNGQVFINTHSSVFANELYENQNIFQVEKKNFISHVKPVTSLQEQMNSIYNLMGGSPNDILLASNFIIVEGRSEFAFLTKIIDRFYTEDTKANKIKILYAGGDNIKQSALYDHLADFYAPLHSNNDIYKHKAVFLLDKISDAKKQSKYDDFKKYHPWLVENEHLHMIPFGDIEMYYPKGHEKDKVEIAELDKKREKVTYAQSVAEIITNNQFEKEMPIVHQMLKKAIEFAYD